MKKEKIKNKHYKQFMEEGIIETISTDKIEQALNNIKGKHRKEGRCLLIAMYWTGARPNEILRIKAKDISKEKTYIKIMVLGSKGGLPRTIYIPQRKPFIKELYSYAMSFFEEILLFYNYRTAYKRKILNKKGQEKEYYEMTDGLRGHFKKWFKGVTEDPIPPYFLRHNRFSKLSEAGASMEELRQIKGSKTFNSIQPYLHMSSKSAKSVGKKMD